MFESMVNTAKVAHDNCKAENERYFEECKVIRGKYINAELVKHMEEAKADHENKIESIAIHALDAVKESFDDIRLQAKRIATEPALPELLHSIEALKNIDSPTRLEINNIIDSAKDNYITFRTLCSVAGGKLKGHNCLIYDDIVDMIDDAEKTIVAVIDGARQNPAGAVNNSFGIDSYMTALVISGHYLRRFDETVTAFLNKQFDFVGNDD